MLRVEVFSHLDVVLALSVVIYHFLVGSSGIDASAQTSSHEMTIPNDVSTSHTFKSIFTTV